MLAKLSTLVFLLPFVSALTVNAPAGLTAGGTTTISWSATTTDPPTFSIELVNTAFNKEYAIANNVQTLNGEITIELPQVLPGDGYSINFVATNDVAQVYASSGDFSIGSQSSSSGTAASTSATPATTASSATTPGSSSAPTVAPTFTTPATAPTVNTGSATGTSSASASPSNLSTGGAASFRLTGVAPAAALVLSAVVGAVMVF